jgi:hypothetical protein
VPGSDEREAEEEAVAGPLQTDQAEGNEGNEVSF